MHDDDELRRMVERAYAELKAEMNEQKLRGESSLRDGPWGPRGLDRPDEPPALPYADFWTRALAYVIDNLCFSSIASLLLTFSLAILTSLHGEAYAEAWRKEPNNVLLMNAMLISAESALYAYFASSAWQASPGQRLCGIYVVRKSGRPIGAGFALLRFFLSALSGLPLGLGFFMAAWTKEKTTLHDLILNTRVVYGRLNQPENDAARIKRR